MIHAIPTASNSQEQSPSEQITVGTSDQESKSASCGVRWDVPVRCDSSLVSELQCETLTLHCCRRWDWPEGETEAGRQDLGFISKCSLYIVNVLLTKMTIHVFHVIGATAPTAGSDCEPRSLSLDCTSSSMTGGCSFSVSIAIVSCTDLTDAEAVQSKHPCIFTKVDIRSTSTNKDHRKMHPREVIEPPPSP